MKGKSSDLFPINQMSCSKGNKSIEHIESRASQLYHATSLLSTLFALHPQVILNAGYSSRQLRERSPQCGNTDAIEQETHTHKVYYFKNKTELCK